MFYQIHELQRAGLAPFRVAASQALSLLDLPGNPWRPTPIGRLAAAALDSFEHSTRHFGKPAFGHHETWIQGEPVEVTETVVHASTWCNLLNFRRAVSRPNDPRLLIVAPLSGHYATLLRGTVAEFLPDHDVFITDWVNASEVPALAADFDLDDYIDLIAAYLRLIGPRTHVLAVCQPAVPVLAATALMNERRDPDLPASITLIGGPIDTREAPTEVNTFAKTHSLDWFRTHVIDWVPMGRPGCMRRVYPGYVQLAGFMAMNLGRHLEAHWQMFLHLVDGDGESLAEKRAFYDEYRAVMDLPAEYYLQTIETVFQKHLLPRGLLISRGRAVRPEAIDRSALLTIEGERDDISGLGQTRAAHKLCRSLPASMREHAEQAGVGHYGLFNGRRYREQVAPRIKRFIAAHA